MDDPGTKQITSQLPITIQPINVFGIRSDVKGNIHFNLKQEVIYPVAGVLAVHNYTTNTQKFLRFSEHSVPEIICMAPNRKYIAVSERQQESQHVINVYDLSTLKKRKSLYMPYEIPNRVPGAMAFTFDSKGLAVLSKEPDAFLVLLLFDKAETVVIGRVSNGGQPGITATYLSCSPLDIGIIAVGGDYTLKILNRLEKGFGPIGAISGEGRIVTSLSWLTGEILAVGTADTTLLIFEGGDLKAQFDAQAIEKIDLGKSEKGEGDLEPVTTETTEDIPIKRNDVNCLTNFVKGFCYAIHNVVYVFERENNYRYSLKTIITIAMNMYADHNYRITNVAINAQQDTIIATTAVSQIYIGILFVPETLQIKYLDFNTLGEPLHIDKIIGMSVCSWKPIIMTASRDQTIRIWNYDTGEVELVKKYQVDVTVIGLHPSGIFVAVGFSDQLRLMEILLDDLKITKTFNFPRCSAVEFSHQGHMLAAGYENLVTIVSVFSFDIIRTLKGHNGQIASLAWSLDDKRLVSSGTEGAVYEWELDTGTRLNECVQKGIEYRKVAVTNDMESIYVITDGGLVREMANSDIKREIKTPGLPPLSSIALSRSNLVMFLSSEKGHLYNVQLPFLEAGGGTCTNYRFFQGAITQIMITFDDSILATGSDDGTIVFWVILNNEGKKAPKDPELGKCADVMIPRKDLLEKIENITSLEIRIAQQIDEFQYQLRQGDAFHSEQIRDIHTSYCTAIEDLKDKNEQMERNHIEELNVITTSIAKTKEEHSQAIMDLEANFHEKIIIEYEKSASIKKTMDDMRDDYEVKLRKSAGCLQDTIEALETDFRKQLQERQNLIRELMTEMESKKNEFIEYCRQVDIDNDRNMVESKLHYEGRLNEENEQMLKWRAEAGVLKKKNSTLLKKAEEYKDEIQTLRDEHIKTHKNIQSSRKDIEDLRKEIEDRDQTIRDKEKRVNELQQKNQELEKYKQVLNHKISELKSQIEPREREIKEKKDQIADMEFELEGLQQSNLQLELQLSEMTDKIRGTEIDLKLERTRSKTARAQVSKICGDIYTVSGYVQQPTRLKDSVVKLYHKYSDDIELKRSLQLDAEVQNEFNRQRDHLEKIASNRNKKIKKKDSVDLGRLIKDNTYLLTELNSLRIELKNLQRTASHMESILGLSNKFISAQVAREKLEKACADYDAIELKHAKEKEKLEECVNTLTAENQKIRSDLLSLQKLLSKMNQQSVLDAQRN